MFSPLLKLEKDKFYEVVFETQVKELDTCYIEITLGNDVTVESQKVIQTFNLTNKNFVKKYLKLPEIAENGNYTIGVRSLKTQKGTKVVRIANLEVKETTASSVQGTVTFDGSPVEGATINYKQEDKIIVSAQTDAEGRYSIPYIAAGNYNCIIDKEGYLTIEEEININALSSYTLDYELSLRDQSKLTGKLVDARNNPIAGATIRLTGYKIYKAQSNTDGTFEIKNVYNASYKLSVFKTKHEQLTQSISIDGNTDCGDLTLEDQLLPPTNVKAETDNTKSTIMWQQPTDTKQFRYDNGTMFSTRGWASGDYTSVMGSVYRQPAILSGMSWHTVEDGYRDHDTLDVFVFDLDENGEPINKILYHASKVLNKPDNWITHTFETPVECLNGFAIALSCNGFLSLGVDNGTDPEYPFHEGTMCASKDYTAYPFDYLENQNPGFRQNFMLRAEGSPIGPEYDRTIPAGQTPRRQMKMQDENQNCRIETRILDAPIKTQPLMASPRKSESSYQPSYFVYRFNEADENNTENWELLTTDPINGLSYQDRNWSVVPKGVYKYAVKAIYTGNKESVPVVTEKVGKDMSATVAVTLMTNLTGGSTEGAVVRLESAENRYTGKADTSGKVTLKGVWKDKYDLTVMTLGCETYTKKADYSVNNEYQETIQLKEKITSPSKLKIENTEKTDERLFNWNDFKIFDDFESHQDFAINSPGEIGWDYIDGDGALTISLQMPTYTFVHPGLNSPMAYMVFSPALVKPSMSELIKPHSGNKVMVCYAASHAANNDYIISPELDTADDFIFSFYAYSFAALENNFDKMRVGYSFTGKEEADFIWMTEPIDVEGDYWKLYEYTIPAGARYVTINCVSEKRMLFIVDDIYIGASAQNNVTAPGSVGYHTYEIYLNGKKVATQTQNSYLFTNLENGNHTAGVKAVYATGATEISTVNFEVSGSSIENITNEGITLYPIPAKDRLYINGQYEKLSIYDMSGMLISEYDNSISSIDVTNLSSGVYMVKIINGGKTQTKKLIINKN